MSITKKQLKNMVIEAFAQEMADLQLQTITGRPDHEVEMAYRQLKKAARYSQSLRDRMENMGEANLPAWVQAKVTKASDYLSSVHHYMDDYLHGGEEKQINEMMDIDPTMVAGAMAGLGSLWYMISSMKDAVEAGRQKEADEYMADIHRIMAKNGLKVPSTPSGGVDPKRAQAMRQLADLKAKRKAKPKPAQPELGMPKLAPPEDISPKELARYTAIVNKVRNNFGLRDSDFDAAPPQIKNKIESSIQQIAKSLIKKHGKEKLDMAMKAGGDIYKQ